MDVTSLFLSYLLFGGRQLRGTSYRIALCDSAEFSPTLQPTSTGTEAASSDSYVDATHNVSTVEVLKERVPDITTALKEAEVAAGVNVVGSLGRGMRKKRHRAVN